MKKSVTVTVKRRADYSQKAATARAASQYIITSDRTIKYRVRGLCREYRVWFAGQWFWSAGAQGGTAPSQFMAEQLAKRWLRDGQ